MTQKIFTLLLIFSLFFASPITGQAVPPPIPPPPPPGLPIDGGVLFLFVSGLIYGIKKIKKGN